MYIDDSLMSYEESLVFQLRALYREKGYKRYKMSKFETYDLYATNKDFLLSDHVISFTDTNGKLMALKPDVTLSLVQNCRYSADSLAKICYDENVYRVSQQSGSFKELAQAGVECLGAVDDQCIIDVLLLASQSLACVSEQNKIVVTDLDLLSSVVDAWNFSGLDRQSVYRFIKQKNLHELEQLCKDRMVAEEELQRLLDLLRFDGEAHALPSWLVERSYAQKAVARVQSIVEAFEAAGLSDTLRFDFSLVNDTAYYNGVVFQGYVFGVPSAVLSGGCYDKLLGKLGKQGHAVGFAVYVDALGSFAKEACCDHA